MPSARWCASCRRRCGLKAGTAGKGAWFVANTNGGTREMKVPLLGTQSLNRARRAQGPRSNVGWLDCSVACLLKAAQEAGCEHWTCCFGTLREACTLSGFIGCFE